MKKLTIEQLRIIAEGAALTLRDANEHYEARKVAYQEGFIPEYLAGAQRRYKAAREAYEAALEAAKDKPQ